MRPLFLTVVILLSFCFSQSYSQSKFEISPYIGYNSVNKFTIDSYIDDFKYSSDNEVQKTLSISFGANVLYNINPKFKAGAGAEFIKVDDINFFIPYVTAYGVFPLKYAKPYVKAQLGMTNASTKSSDSYRGLMYSIGVGASFSLSDRLDIYTDVSYKYFDFNTHQPYLAISVGATNYNTVYKYNNVYGTFGVSIHL